MDDSALAWLPRFLSHLSVERRLSPHTDRTTARPAALRCLSATQVASRLARVDSQHVRMFAARVPPAPPRSIHVA
jgi:site-specific recombinase XerC